MAMGRESSVDSEAVTRKRPRSPKRSGGKRARADNSCSLPLKGGTWEEADHARQHARPNASPDIYTPVIDLDEVIQNDNESEADGGRDGGGGADEVDNDRGHTNRVIAGHDAVFYAEATDDEDSNARWRRAWGFADLDEQDEAAAEQLRRETEHVGQLQPTAENNTHLDFGDIESTYKCLLSYNSVQAPERGKDDHQGPGIDLATVEIDHAPLCDTRRWAKEVSIMADVSEPYYGASDFETPSDAEEIPRPVVEEPKKKKKKKTPKRRLQRRKPARAESEGEEMFCRKEYIVGGYIVEELVRNPVKKKTGKRARRTSSD